MSTSKKPAPQGAEPTSLSDAAYRFAGTVASAETLAQYVIAQDSGFPDSPQDATVAALKSGFLLRYSEKNPPARFLRKGEDTYVPVSDAVKDGDILSVTVAYATVMTGQEFGKLRASQPNLHGIVSPVREAASNYVAAMMSNLKRVIARIRASGATRQRGVTKDWTARMESLFVEMDKSLAKAAKRGDTTVPADAKYAAARRAFWDALK